MRSIYSLMLDLFTRRVDCCHCYKSYDHIVMSALVLHTSTMCCMSVGHYTIPPLALHLSPPFPPLPIPAYVDLLVTGVLTDFVH